MDATFTIPSSWLNKYAIEDSTTTNGMKYISFFEKNNHSSNGKGLLFKYCLYPDDSYNTLSSYTEYGTVTSLDGTYYAVCVVPAKAQYNTKSKGLTKAYKALNKKADFKSICESAVFNNSYVFDPDGCSTEPSSTVESNTDSTENSSSTATTATTANTSSKTGLVFSDISTRKLTASDLENLSQDEIQQAINDICALHGYNFTTPSIKSHYQQFSWYKPSSSFSESSFNSVEEYNYKLLQKYRN
jgi:hypothetical protein